MTALRNGALWIYIGAITLVFAGLLLLAARSVFSVLFLACGVIAMFVTAFSQGRITPSEKGK
jgi:hypothetical protein